MNIPDWFMKMAGGAAILFLVFVVSNLPIEQLVYGALAGATVCFAIAAGAGLIGQGTLDAWNSFVGATAVGIREWAMTKVRSLRSAP